MLYCDGSMSCRVLDVFGYKCYCCWSSLCLSVTAYVLPGVSLAMCAAHITRLIPGNTLAVTERHKEDQQQ